MRTFGYIGVSTNKQADKGCSLEAQREKIRMNTVPEPRAALLSLTGPAVLAGFTVLRRRLRQAARAPQDR